MQCELLRSSITLSRTQTAHVQKLNDKAPHTATTEW